MRPYLPKPDVVQPIKRLSVADAAYIAGLVDGEGYVAITANRTGQSDKSSSRGISFRGIISVRMCTRGALDFAAQATGYAKVKFCRSRQENHKDCWQWNVWSREAAELARKILPFLRVKNRQAQNLIEFQAMMRQPGCLGLSDTEWEKRTALHAISAHLNKRGASGGENYSLSL